MLQAPVGNDSFEWLPGPRNGERSRLRAAYVHVTSMEDTASYDQLLGDVFYHGNIAMAQAMAKETGMIQHLCTAKDPLSSTQVADALKLKERYVREILNSLTVGGLLQLQEGTGGKDGQAAKYWVPEACRPSLRTVSNFTLAISLMARQFETLKECFALDGPVGPRYAANTFDALDAWAMETLEYTLEILLKIPGFKERMESGIEALEVGCGTGRLFLRLAVLFPKSHFTLTDVNAGVLERARKRAEDEGIANVSFKLLDVCQVPDDFKECYDWLFANDVIHDLPHPLRAMQGINKALKPGGQFTFVDEFVSSYVAENLSNYKDSGPLYAMGTFICIPESYQQPDSEALGPCWGKEKAFELLSKAGLKVLSLTRSGISTTSAVCTCQKQE